jgi:Na+-driven multidrug efflux pump
MNLLPNQNMMLIVYTSGVAVGSGWQSTVAYINIGCYYIIGIPLGILLGWLFHLGVLVLIELLRYQH